jgi:prephenate dehydratase
MSGDPPSLLMSVGYQGAPGAFSEQAIHECLTGPREAVGFETFEGLGRAVESGAVAFGMLPVENTLAGTVDASYDVLVACQLEIVAEVVIPIHHCVVAVEGATIAALRRVISHPVALAQCKRFFMENRHIEAVADYDTAGAANKVSEAGDPTIAAIAASGAASRYRLTVLAAGVEDRPDNQTRFFLVRSADSIHRPPLRGSIGSDRAVIVAKVANEPGALLALLDPIARAGINLSKIEGRPAPEPWNYDFVVEMEARGQRAGIDYIVKQMTNAAQVRVLGRFSRIGAGAVGSAH